MDRSQSVRFILIDDQIFNSPKLMTILASQIIDKCRTVGLVEFAHLFEDTRLVGLLKNGTVKIFDGIKPNTQHTKTFILPNGLLRTRFQWGYFIYKDTGINTGIK